MRVCQYQWTGGRGNTAKGWCQRMPVKVVTPFHAHTASLLEGVPSIRPASWHTSTHSAVFPRHSTVCRILPSTYIVSAYVCLYGRRDEGRGGVREEQERRRESKRGERGERVSDDVSERMEWVRWKDVWMGWVRRCFCVSVWCLCLCARYPPLTATLKPFPCTLPPGLFPDCDQWRRIWKI